MKTTRELVVDPRYNGPQRSGNGGWVAGSLARLLGEASVSVSLRAPTPLGTPLSVLGQDDGSITLMHGSLLVAEAQLAPLELDVPAPPSWQVAQTAGDLARQANMQGSDGEYARCFGCGFWGTGGLDDGA